MIRRPLFLKLALLIAACAPSAATPPTTRSVSPPATVPFQASLSTVRADATASRVPILQPTPINRADDLSEHEATQDAFATIELATMEAYYRPPSSSLEIGGRQQVSGIGAYCWRGGCADGPAIRTALVPLSAHAPIEAHLQLPVALPPDELSLQVLRMTAQDEIQSGQDWREWNIDKDPEQTMSLLLQPEQDFVVSLAPGVYVLLVFARWDETGDVLYGFSLQVE